MKIKGFIEDRTPFISANLIIGHLNINRPITFLIDTGASNTAIMDKDGEAMRVDYTQLERVAEPMIGIGGSCETFQTREVALVFTCGDNSLHIE